MVFILSFYYGRKPLTDSNPTETFSLKGASTLPNPFNVFWHSKLFLKDLGSNRNQEFFNKKVERQNYPLKYL